LTTYCAVPVEPRPRPAAVIVSAARSIVSVEPTWMLYVSAEFSRKISLNPVVSAIRVSSLASCWNSLFMMVRCVSE
jgi:hypothetical protein